MDNASNKLLASQCAVVAAVLAVSVIMLWTAPAAAEEDAPFIVILTAEDPQNYQAYETMPAFAEMLRREHGYRVKVIFGEGEPDAFRFPGLEALEEADLLVVFFRRRALSPEQFGILRDYLGSGKPLVALRTANHAFSLREDPAEGYEDWWDFVPDILGCEAQGWGVVELGTAVTAAPGAEDHPLLEGVEPLDWQSEGVLYRVDPLVDEDADVLLMGAMDDVAGEPIAWTRTTAHGGRVFYTSLGYPSDFEQPQFVRLLINGVQWALGEAE